MFVYTSIHVYPYYLLVKFDNIVFRCLILFSISLPSYSRGRFISEKCNVPMRFDPRTSRNVTHCSINWANGDCHYHISWTYYGSLRSGAYPLYPTYPKSHHNLLTIPQLPTFNPIRFPILTTIGYLVARQCNSRACLDRGPLVTVVNRHSTNWAKGDLHSVNVSGYEPTTVALTCGRGGYPLQYIF